MRPGTPAAAHAAFQAPPTRRPARHRLAASRTDHDHEAEPAPPATSVAKAATIAVDHCTLLGCHVTALPSCGFSLQRPFSRSTRQARAESARWRVRSTHHRIGWSRDRSVARAPAMFPATTCSRNSSTLLSSMPTLPELLTEVLVIRQAAALRADGKLEPVALAPRQGDSRECRASKIVSGSPFASDRAAIPRVARAEESPPRVHAYCRRTLAARR